VLDSISGAVFFDRPGASDGAENPSDYMYIAGHYAPQEHRPAGNDNEGSDIVTVDSALQGKKWVKYSNDDKFTPSSHVMLKISVPSPTRVYINVAERASLATSHRGFRPAELNGWTHETANTGVKYTSSFEVRGHSAEETWGNGLRVEHFQDGHATVTEEFEGAVYSKVFPAGEIMLPGNGGKDGSYLIFLESLEERCWAGAESRWAIPPLREEAVPQD